VSCQAWLLAYWYGKTYERDGGAPVDAGILTAAAGRPGTVVLSLSIGGGQCQLATTVETKII